MKCKILSNMLKLRGVHSLMHTHVTQHLTQFIWKQHPTWAQSIWPQQPTRTEFIQQHWKTCKIDPHLTQAEFIRSQHLTWAEVCVKEVSRLLSTSIYFIQKLYTCIFNEHPMTELFKSQTLLQLFLFITPLLIGFCLKIFLLLNQDKQDKQED